MFLHPRALLPVLFLGLECFLALTAPVGAAEADLLTLTDLQGRALRGEVVGRTAQEVQFRIEGKGVVAIPLERLSKESRVAVRYTGLKWPAKAPLDASLKVRTDGNVWTSRNVRMVLPEPIKGKVNADPQLAILRYLERLTAAAKAIPVADFVDPRRIVECQVVEDLEITRLEAKAGEQEMLTRLRDPILVGPGGMVQTSDGTYCRRPLFNMLGVCDPVAETFSMNREVFERVWDKSAQNLNINRRSLAGPYLCAVLGDRLTDLPAELQQGMIHYLVSLPAVAGEDLDYVKVPRGLAAAMKGDGFAQAIGDQPRVAQVEANLGAGRFPTGVDAMLFLYYLLHLDGNGQAPGLAGFYRVLAQQREGPPPTIDDYRKAIVEYRTAGARRDQLSRERTVALTAYEEAVRNHVKPLPARPPELPPEPRIPEILKKIPDQQAFEALVRERRKEADKALLRGRTFAEVALDFKAKMAPLLGE